MPKDPRPTSAGETMRAAPGVVWAAGAEAWAPAPAAAPPPAVPAMASETSPVRAAAGWSGVSGEGGSSWVANSRGAAIRALRPPVCCPRRSAHCIRRVDSMLQGVLTRREFVV